MTNIKTQTDPDPTICERCAKLGPTCCRLSPGDEELCFPLSKMEWERILDANADKGAFVQTPNTAPFRTNMRRLFPKEERTLAELFPIHGVHLRLATDKSGACVFLGPKGCTLIREVRPYYCRLFPFWLMDNSITIFTPDHCLAFKEHPQIRQLLQAMGMTVKTVRELHGRMRLAWGLPPKEGMPLPETVISRQKK